jgi:hypothetical protein
MNKHKELANTDENGNSITLPARWEDKKAIIDHYFGEGNLIGYKSVMKVMGTKKDAARKYWERMMRDMSQDVADYMAEARERQTQRAIINANALKEKLKKYLDTDLTVGFPVESEEEIEKWDESLRKMVTRVEVKNINGKTMYIAHFVDKLKVYEWLLKMSGAFDERPVQAITVNMTTNRIPD